MINDTQLEIGFDPATLATEVSPRDRRFNRARWWFGQMHRAVDAAAERNHLVAPGRTARRAVRRERCKQEPTPSATQPSLSPEI